MPENHNFTITTNTSQCVEFFHSLIILSLIDIFSHTSAKAECDLSSLYGMFFVCRIGGPPGQDFMGPYQNATLLLYDFKFAMTKKTLPQLNCHGCIW